jgi:hypothetical protein
MVLSIQRCDDESKTMATEIVLQPIGHIFAMLPRDDSRQSEVRDADSIGPWL